MAWGPSTHRKGRKVSAATRAKLSAAAKRRKGKPHKGHKLSAQAKAKISAKLRGKHHAGHKLSNATKAKISAALKGKHHPGSHKGHPMSNAARAKISAALKGRHHVGHPMSASARAKISAALKGKHHPGHPLSASARAKISASLLARHGHTAPVRPHKPGTHGTRRGTHGNRLHHAVHGRASLGARGAHHHLRKAGPHTGRHNHHFGRRGFVSAHTHRSLKGLVHTKTRHHRHRPVLRRRPRARRVWRRRR